MDVEKINGRAWDGEEERGNWWTRIVSGESIRKAEKGDLELRITTSRSVPPSWYIPLKGRKVLSLCGGGGQQTPLLSAYGCTVTSIDISEKQIEQDRKALSLYGLEGETVVGSVLDMPFENSSFDAVVNPVSLNFVDDLGQAYDEITRVLRKGGTFMTGIANPVLYIFDEKKIEKKLKVKYTLPFSALTSLSEKEREKRIERGDTLEFSHTLSSIIGGILERGFVLEDFFSDSSLCESVDSFISDAFLGFLFRKVR